jgi:hypothetical protein
VRIDHRERGGHGDAGIDRGPGLAQHQQPGWLARWCGEVTIPRSAEGVCSISEGRRSGGDPRQDGTILGVELHL